ncbi:MAG TPA: thioesterase family protein [Anaerolineaceae bacterium]
MKKFHFYLPIEVRYSDLDPQWHVNHARCLSFFEQARFAYLVKLGLWDGKSFLDLGLIVASVKVDYLAPIFLGQNVQVGMRVERIGNKSLTMVYVIEDTQTGQALVNCETVMVSYNYHTKSSIPVPSEWRQKITDFEAG